jgi:HEAT repeat protein
VVYLRRGNLAGSRAMLYREVIDALLEMREGDPHQRAQLRHMLADTALQLYQVKGRTFSEDDLRATLTSLSTEQQATWTVEETLYRVLNSGLLDVVAHETYSFRHQTFQEYLVASALARRFMSTGEQTRQAGQQQAWSKHTYSRWSEIARLLVGILVQEYGEEGTLTARAWLTRLLQQQSSPEGDPGNLSLELAIKVLGEVAKLEEWQAAETLELEERTAVRWVITLDSIHKRSFLKREPYQRLFRVAPEIGRLRPSAQNKALDIILNGSYYEIGSRLGAIHSAVAAERLRTAWQSTSNPWGRFNDAFPKLGVYAPVDLILPLLESQKHHLNVQAILILKGVGRYAPVHGLIALLTKESPETRRAAADALIEIAQNVELPVEVLLAILQQKQEYRFDAARVLARLQHPAAIEPAISALTDADARTRQDAILALGSFKASMLTETIISLQNDPEEQVRKAVVEALSNLGSDAPMQPFLTALQDEDGEVRMTAVQALGRMETRAPVSTLVAMLRDIDSEVVTITLQVLGRTGDHVPLEPLLEMLHHPNWDILHQAIKTLGEKQIIERAPLERLLDFYANHWTYRTAMFNTLSQAVTLLPPSFLISALNDSDPTIAKSAAQALGRRTDQLVEESLLDEIGTRYWRSQSHAIKLLAMHLAETHLERFLHALGDENPSVIGHAAQELEKIADIVPSKRLQQALQCSYPWVRVNTLHILAKRAEPPAPEMLLTAQADPHEQVREAAAQAVASWPADTPLEHLLEATRDHYDSVRLAAAQSLSKVGLRDPARALEGLLNVLCYPKFTSNDGDDSFKTERAIKRMLLSLVPYAPPVEPLYQAMLDLHQRKSWLARTAAVVLGATGERAPIAQLTQCLHDEDEDLRILAVIALGKAGQSTPVQDLIQALEDSPRVRLVVIMSLCDLYTYVPGEVFLSLIREDGHHVHTYSVLLLALLNKGERIPGDILLRQLEPGQKFWGHGTTQKFISYFRSLEQWPSVLPSILVAGFASLLYDYTIPTPELEELCQLLLSQFSLDLLLETLTHAHESVRKGGLCLLFYYSGNVPLENLLLALNDSHACVRLVALYCIQAHTDRLPLQQFSRLLHDRDWQVRRAAIEALGTLGPEAPVNDLLTVVDESGENIPLCWLFGTSVPKNRRCVP